MIVINQSIELVKKKLPVFIIGAGGIVRDAHLPAYRKGGFDVAGICDLDRVKAEQIQLSFPEIAGVYESPEAFLRLHAGEEVVYDVAVPADAVLPILEKLPHGAVVLIQKPMGETLDEAKAIFDMCMRRSFVAAINFQLRYAPFNLAAKSLIDQGAIGEVYDVEVAVCVNTPWHLWGFLREKPRVEILYHSIHYLDLVRFFLGDPVKVYASTVKHPRYRDLASTRTTMILDYNSSTQARIITNHGHDFGPQEQQSYLKIEGTKGAIKVRIGVSLNYPAGAPDQFLFTSADTGGRWTEVRLFGTWFPDAFIGPMNNVQGMAQQQGIDRLATLRDNLQTMRLVEAAYRSSESGGVKLAEIR